MANTSVKLIFEISFLAFRNINVSFAWKEFTWRFYTTLKALPTTKQIKVIA